MITFLNTKIGRSLAAIGGFLAIVAAAVLKGISMGSKRKEDKLHEADLQRAEQVRRRVEAARGADDDRSALEQLRDAGRLRD